MNIEWVYIKSAQDVPDKNCHCIFVIGDKRYIGVYDLGGCFNYLKADGTNKVIYFGWSKVYKYLILDDYINFNIDIFT